VYVVDGEGREAFGANLHDRYRLRKLHDKEKEMRAFRRPSSPIGMVGGSIALTSSGPSGRGLMASVPQTSTWRGSSPRPVYGRG
jgi:hypothetical protein